MNEEEKQAIEILNSQLLKTDGYDRHQKAIDIILNLIDKQQDEIEQQRREIYDLYQTTRDYEKMTDITIIPGTGFKVDRSGYISKDKIREIISKYVDIEEHLVYHHEELWGSDLAEMIKELLGE